MGVPNLHLTIRLQARDFYEVRVDEGERMRTRWFSCWRFSLPYFANRRSILEIETVRSLVFPSLHKRIMPQ